MNKRKIYRLFISLILFPLLAACRNAAIRSADMISTFTPSPPPEVAQAPLELKPPICTPPKITIDNVISFCANPGLGLGGASFDYQPDKSLVNFSSNNMDCDSSSSDKVVCWGPQNEKFEQVGCTACAQSGGGQFFVYESGIVLATVVKPGQIVCANGYIEDEFGKCITLDPTEDYFLCPPGSHFNNALQNCVDDKTEKSTPVCPHDYPNYLPYEHMCSVDPNFVVYDCQTFTLQLGECSVSPKGGGADGAEQSCPSGSSWNAGLNCCTNADHRCQ